MHDAGVANGVNQRLQVRSAKGLRYVLLELTRTGLVPSKSASARSTAPFPTPGINDTCNAQSFRI